MISAGTYNAKIASHAITETKSGDPQAAVTFDIVVDGKLQKITWYGSFKEGKAREITLRALLTCGLKGNNPAGALEIGKEVSIVVDIEDDDQGRPRSKVRWVNAVGITRNVIPQDLAKAKLSALEGAVASARAANGNAPSDDDEIPF